LFTEHLTVDVYFCTIIPFIKYILQGGLYHIISSYQLNLIKTWTNEITVFHRIVSQKYHIIFFSWYYIFYA